MGCLWEKPLKQVFSGCFVEFGSLRSFPLPDKTPTMSPRILELRGLIVSDGDEDQARVVAACSHGLSAEGRSLYADSADLLM